MKTFENLQQEIPSVKECLSDWGRTHNFSARRREIIKAGVRKSFSLHKRIFMRGNKEQYNCRFLPNYHADQKKRISRNWVAYLGNI